MPNMKVTDLARDEKDEMVINAALFPTEAILSSYARIKALEEKHTKCMDAIMNVFNAVDTSVLSAEQYSVMQDAIDTLNANK